MKKTYGHIHDQNLKLVIALSRSVQHLRRKESIHIKEAGLTLSQFGVLETLYHKGDLRVCELIEKNLSSGGNMTVVINNLVKEGYVNRFKDPEDQRAFRIMLTESGSQLIEALFPKHVATLEETFSHLSTEEKQTLIQLLKKLSGFK